MPGTPSPSNRIPFFRCVSATSYLPLEYSKNVNNMHVTSTTATSWQSPCLDDSGCSARIALLYWLTINLSLASGCFSGRQFHGCAALNATTACRMACSETRAGRTVACQKGYPNLELNQTTGKKPGESEMRTSLLMSMMHAACRAEGIAVRPVRKILPVVLPVAYTGEVGLTEKDGRIVQDTCFLLHLGHHSSYFWPE